MLTSGAGLIAEDLERYGEPAAAIWVLTCSEEELVRICSVAGWLLENGPPRASGASMLIAKACALAAVYVHEGSPRELARSRRTSRVGPRPDSSWRRPDARLQTVLGDEYGIGADARAFWSQPARPAGEPPPVSGDEPRRPRATKPRQSKSPSRGALLARALHLTMAERLSAFGFTSRAGALFTVPLTPDVVGWLTLATTPCRGSSQVRVVANVGVLHRGIHRLMHRLQPDIKPRRYYPPTIFSPLAAVAAAPSSGWVLEHESALEQFGADLVTTIRHHAIPFMHRYQTLDQIIAALQLQMVLPSDQVAKLFAVALLVNGEPEVARTELASYTASSTHRSDPAADDLRAFNQAFLQHLSS